MPSFCFGARWLINSVAPNFCTGWIPVPRAYRDPQTSLRSAGLVKALRASFAAAPALLVTPPAPSRLAGTVRLGRWLGARRQVEHPPRSLVALEELIEAGPTLAKVTSLKDKGLG